jgi:hypothetical protein
VLDLKFGSYRVDDPGDNIQLSIYALLVARSDETIQEVTCQILSPHYEFKPYTYSREGLARLYQSVLVVINSLSDPACSRRSLPFLSGSAYLQRCSRTGRVRDAC